MQGSANPGAPAFKIWKLRVLLGKLVEPWLPGHRLDEMLIHA